MNAVSNTTLLTSAALIGALQRDRHHRTRVQIHRVLGLVRQRE